MTATASGMPTPAMNVDGAMAAQTPPQNDNLFMKALKAMHLVK
jgi:hypothetical protein